MARTVLLVPSDGASISTSFWNVTVSERFCAATTSQLAPAQPAWLHDIKRAPLFATARSETVLPWATCTLHDAPGQSSPPPVTFPGPFTESVTETIFGGSGSNFATTCASSLIITMQAPLPMQTPFHPEKENPASGMGVSATCAEARKLAEHELPQSIPDGDERTLPCPSTCTVN